jgi:2,3-dimethylmalate lyase
MSDAAARFRALLADGRLRHAPGCSDALTARLVEAAGFELAYLSGATVSAVALGLPDLGFVGRADILQVARTIVGASALPLLADADTGYGNAVHVARTVQDYARAGIAGLHLEDQVAPKRCGHLRGKAVVPVGEATEKIRAAVEASAGGIVVVARTDARSVEGLAAAIDRAGRYAEVGADLVFVEGVHTEADLSVVHAALPEVGLVLNRSEAGGAIEPTPDAVLTAVGVRVVIHPVSAMLAAADAVRRTYADIAADGVAMTPRMGWQDLGDHLGQAEIDVVEQRHAT